MQKIYHLAFPISAEVSVYVIPTIYLVMLYLVWRVRRLNFDLFHATTGMVFLLMVLMTPASPGWFIWSLPFRYDELICYIFLAANIPSIIGIPPLPLLVHYWSLGVEEQFYAFWPWLARMRTEKLLKVASIGIIVLLLLKLIFKIISIKYQITIPYTAIHITRFHCMLLGCIGAILLYRKNEFFLRLTTNLFTQIICWILLLVAAINRFHFFSFIDNELISVIALCLIIGQIKGKNRVVNLENNIMDFLGKISYGIYVFHPLIIFYLSKLFNGMISIGFFAHLLIYLSVTILTIVVAWLSYQYYEKRFLKMKLRFSIIPSSSAKHF